MTVGSRLLSLSTLSSVAVLICTLCATPVAALSVDLHSARDLVPHHAAIAKRKRSTNTKRCKPRPAAPSSPAPPPPAASPAVKASTSPPPAPAPAGNGGSFPVLSGSLKATLDWPNGPNFLDHWKHAKLMYTWTPDCPSNAASLGITCCPMLWGQKFVPEWQQKILNGKPPPCAMGYNEPEIAGQSNMNPQEAAAIWQANMQPLAAKGVTMIAPAVTSDKDKALAWLREFFAACQGCTFHIIALHWYDIHAADFIAWVQAIHDEFHLKVWITEFACQNFNGGPQCSKDQVWQFQSEVTPFLQNTEFVYGYAAFGIQMDMVGVNPLNQLMNPDGTPNALACAYGYCG